MVHSARGEDFTTGAPHLVNVDYEPGGCGCFRDWMDSENQFRTDNEIAPGFYEPTFPAETVCDHSSVAPPGDCPWGGPGPCNNGVAIERYPDRMVLTAHTQAGWYRYSMRWTFKLDGTIEPRFGFSIVNNSCSAATHRHHVYWRFDWDIDGAENDYVLQKTVVGESGAPIAVEGFMNSENSNFWEVYDRNSERGYRITPSAGDRSLPPDTFSKLDFMVSAYHPGEFSDSGGGCAINPNSIANGESVMDTDIVTYYRGGVQDVVGVDIFKCKVAGPTLTPINWVESICGQLSFAEVTAIWNSPEAFYDQNGNGTVDVQDLVLLMVNKCHITP